MGRWTVLLIEDEPLVSKVLGAVLEHAGFEVLAACNGQEARAWMAGRGADIRLLVSDVLLKQENGSVLARQLRDMQPNTPVLYLSGLPLDMLVDRALLPPHAVDGALTRHMQKPFMPAEFLKAVRQLLGTETNQGAPALHTERNVRYAHAAH
jgi:DNA-binding response OmpR family regulator